MGPNARFGYPLKGGFQALMNGFLPLLRGELELNAKVTRIVPSEHEIAVANGKLYRYEQLVSTMPLPVLVSLIGDEAPKDVRTAAKALRHVSVRCVNLGIARTGVTEKHWIYYPEDSVFHRIFVQGNASPHVNASGGFALTCEITYSAYKPLPCDGDALIQRCIEDCVKVGLLRADDRVIAKNQVDMPYAYVVYDHARAANVEIIRRWLAARDIHLAGRYSEWEYYNSDHAFLAGRKAAERVSEGLAPKHRAPTSREVVAQLLAPATTSAT
jgi:protoporphyrinogen oxidase